jgi:lysozyme
MRTALRAQLIADEGFRSYAYQDSLGVWTIGYGRNIDKRGGGITEAEAGMLLDNDLARVEAEARSAFPWFDGLTEARQDVVLTMLYNLGMGGFLKFRKTITAIAASDYNEAARQMMNSEWAIQVGNRAANLAAQMRGST